MILVILILLLITHVFEQTYDNNDKHNTNDNINDNQDKNNHNTHNTHNTHTNHNNNDNNDNDARPRWRPTPAAAVATRRRGRLSTFRKGGVQWKQGVVIYWMLYTSLLYNATPIHCTPLPLHPPVMNTQARRLAAWRDRQQCYHD